MGKLSGRPDEDGVDVEQSPPIVLTAQRDVIDAPDGGVVRSAHPTRLAVHASSSAVRAIVSDIADTGFLPPSTLDDLAVAGDLPGLLEALRERLRTIPAPAHGANLR